MYRQTAFYVYKLRLLLAGLFAISFIVLICELVTVLGAHSVLAAKTNPVSTFTASTSEGSDALLSGGTSLMQGFRHGSWVVGSSLYRACHSVAGSADETSHIVAKVSVETADAVGRSAVLAVHGVGLATRFTFNTWLRGIIYVIGIPGITIEPLTNIHTVSKLIQPGSKGPLPVIHSQLSAAELASILTQVRQEDANQQKLQAEQAAQATANQSLNGVVVAGNSNHGGYPAIWADAPKDSMIDDWGMLNRECVSYTAWKVYQTYGSMPFWGGVGNANEWPADAQAAGIPIGSTPRVDSVAISMSGYYGHAMWVQAVQGQMIYVSQYNYDMEGHYSEMWVNGSNFIYIYFH